MKELKILCNACCFNQDIEGKHFDFTKLEFLLPFATNDSTGVGLKTATFAFGTSDNYHKFGLKDLPYPVEVEVDFQIVAGKKNQSIEVANLKVLRKVVLSYEPIK